jgi:hypothetical protein
MRIPKFRNLPLSLQLSLEIRDNGLSAADGEEVINVYSDEEYAGAGVTVVDAVLTFETNKTPRQHGVVESTVPDKPTLLHADCCN